MAVSKPPANSPNLEASGALLHAHGTRLETTSELPSLHVSLEGMFIPATAETENLPVDSLLTLHLTCPSGLAGFSMAARVVRVDTPDTSEGPPGLHVEFMELSAQPSTGRGEAVPRGEIPSRDHRVLVVDSDALMRAHRKRYSSAPPTGRPVLKGDLAQVSLSSLLSLMDMERRTGQVRLHRQGEEALMYVRNGMVVQIDLPPREHHREGLERIFYLLDWANGEFVLNASDVEIAGDLSYSTSYTLLEYAKAVDEEEEIRAANASEPEG